jgi:hypothetical protein
MQCFCHAFTPILEKNVIKTLKFAAIQQQKNKRLESTQLADPIVTTCRSPRNPGPPVEEH